MNKINPDGVRSDVVGDITSALNDIGLMYRVFSRSKTQKSLEEKMKGDGEYGKNKKVQDLIGVRVVLYFNDDIRSVRSIVSSIFEESERDVSIDQVGKEEFKAVRYNIVYSLPDVYLKNLNLGDFSNVIDGTFELQIRTIFSEGWHEIEHDLRYKCQEDWTGFDGESRLLNGVYASLENSEWTMIKIFEGLAYSHYKSKQWSAMLRQKFRLRFVDQDLGEDLRRLFDDDSLLAKKIFRIDREFLILEMCRRGFYYPVTMDNIVFFANIISVKDARITAVTPELMRDDMNVHS